MRLPEIKIREANEGDIEQIIAVARSFFKYGGTDADSFDVNIFEASCQTLVNSSGFKCFVATHNEWVVGYYAVSVGSLFSVRPFMYEVHFAVLPEFRLSHAARMLTARVIEYGRKVDALAFYAGATSGIKQFDNSLINMYSKQGMAGCGQMMRYIYG